MTFSITTEPERSATLISPETHGPMLEALGVIITRWGFLESIVEHLLAGLLATQVYMLLHITADIPVGTRLKHLRLLGRLRLDDEYFSIFDGLIIEVTELVTHRNRVVHGLWASYEDNGNIVEVYETRPTKIGGFRQVSQYYNREYLVWLASEITKCLHRLDSFGRQFGIIRSDA